MLLRGMHFSLNNGMVITQYICIFRESFNFRILALGARDGG